METLLREFYATLAEAIGAHCTPEEQTELHDQARVLLVTARQQDASVTAALNERDRQIEANQALIYQVRDLERDLKEAGGG